MTFKRHQCFFLGQITPYSLKEGDAESFFRPTNDSVCSSSADSVGDHFKCLSDVDDKCSGDHWDVYPVTILVQNLKAFDMGRGRLEEKCPPAGGVFVGTNALSLRPILKRGVMDQLEPVLVGKEPVQNVIMRERKSLGYEAEKAFTEGR